MEFKLGSKEKIYTSPQSGFGEAASGTYTHLYHETAELSPTIEKVDDNSKTGTRIRLKDTVVKKSGQGTINTNLTAYFSDYLFESTLQGEVVVAQVDGGSSAGQIDITSADQKITFASSADFADFAGAKIVTISGSATSANNGVKRVASIDAVAYEITLVAGSITSDDDTTTTAGLGFNSKYLVNGETPSYFTIERRLEDSVVPANSEFHTVPDGTVDQLEVSINALELCKANFTIKGTGYNPATATASISDVPASGHTTINASNDVAGIYIDGVLMTQCKSTLSFNINNGLRDRDCIGSETSAEFGSSTLEVTGSVEVYYKDKTFIDLANSNGSFSISSLFIDDNGNGYLFTIPNVTITNGAALNTGDKEGDVMQTVEFKAFATLVDQVMVQIDFISA